LFVKNTLIVYFYIVIIKTSKVKKYFTNFWLDWNKFPEISELTTLIMSRLSWPE